MTYEAEAQAVMNVIKAETNAFWMKDYDALAQCWLHSPDVRILGWWARGGISVREGWESIGALFRQLMEDNPTPNPESANVRRENINIRVTDQMAWVTFDQYGADTGELDMDMPGLSHETRILEKHDGAWKIVYTGWLLTGE